MGRSAHRQMAAELLQPRRRGDRRRPTTRSNTRTRASAADAGSTDLRAELAPNLDLLRGRLSALPEQRHPGRRSAGSRETRPQHCADPAFPATGPPSSRRSRSAPIPTLREATTARRSCCAVKYIDDRLLREIGNRPATAGSARDRRTGAGRRRAASPSSPMPKATPSRALPGSRRGPAARSWRAWRHSSPWRWPVSRCWSVW